MMIRRALAVFMLTYIACGQSATFDQASRSYKQKNYAQAYEQFLELAGLGNRDAQMNIGIMHFHGQGTEKDVVEAYAWMSVASNKNDKAKIATRDATKKLLNAKQIEQAKLRIKALKEIYSPKAINERILPGSKKSGDGEYREPRIIKNYHPKINSRRHTLARPLAHKFGSVRVDFVIGKDGITRMHTISAYEYMENALSAVEGIKGRVYEPAMYRGVPVDAYGETFRVLFTGDTHKANVPAALGALDDLRDKAEKGGGAARYRYAITADLMRTTLDDEGAREALSDYGYWYRMSAIDGYPAAKFKMGLNQLRGTGCAVNHSKSLFWLESAAKDGYANAQLFLGMEYLSGVRYNKNEKLALMWMKAAADAGLDHAQVKLAWILATHSDPKIRNIKSANEYFNKVNPKSYLDKLSWHETNAVIAAAMGDFKRAVKMQKKAIREAKKYELPLIRLENNLDKYKNTLVLGYND